MYMNEGAARQAAEAAVAPLLTELERWVMIDSGTHDKAGVDQVAELAAARFVRSGFTVEVVPESALGNHVVARRAGSGQTRLLLVGHLDTVYPTGDVALRPFAIRDGRAYGPGIFDMKSGVLAGITALDLAGPAVLDRFASITFLCNSDEEIGSPSSTPLVRRLAGEADVVLVLEPTRDPRNITVGRKGVASFTLEVRGLAAHAGVMPEAGRNAILELAHLIVDLQALHGSLPSLSLNVGEVSGGGRRNVVPEFARALFEMRAATRTVFEAGIAAVGEIVTNGRRVPDTTVTLTQGPTHQPLEPAPEFAWLRDLAAGAGLDLGLSLRFQSIGGASDGNTTGGMGIPTLDGLGLVGQNSHHPEECIILEHIPLRLRLLQGIIERLAEH